MIRWRRTKKDAASTNETRSFFLPAGYWRYHRVAGTAHSPFICQKARCCSCHFYCTFGCIRIADVFPAALIPTSTKLIALSLFDSWINPHPAAAFPCQQIRNSRAVIAYRTHSVCVYWVAFRNLPLKSK